MNYATTLRLSLSNEQHSKQPKNLEAYEKVKEVCREAASNHYGSVKIELEYDYEYTRVNRNPRRFYEWSVVEEMLKADGFAVIDVGEGSHSYTLVEWSPYHKECPNPPVFIEVH